MILTNQPGLRSLFKTSAFEIAICLGLLIWLSLSTQCLAATPSSPASSTGLHIRLDVEKAQKSALPKIWLIVENLGETPVVLIRPRRAMIDAHGTWGGWTLSVKGPQGAMTPIAVPGAYVPAMQADVIELRPNESFGVRIALDRFVRADLKPNERPVYISEMPGDYVLQAEYNSKAVCIFGPQNPELSAIAQAKSATETIKITSP